MTIKFGDTDKNTQYNLVADTLNAVPDLDWVVGNAVAADAAIRAIKAAGLASKVQIGSTYQTGPVRTGIEQGAIQWALSDNIVLMASIGLDMGVKAIEGLAGGGNRNLADPAEADADNVMAEASAAGFAPDGFKPVFSVKAMMAVPQNITVKAENLHGEPLLDVRDIEKSFPGVRVLDGVSLDVRRGEVHVLFGENGAGKSTLVNIILGNYAPDAGAVHLDGEMLPPGSPAWHVIAASVSYFRN
uniref:ATP-binding cassette domain-containing protein n=1 Tax=Rhizobium sp. RCAM05350 TaxID=2895568 RepID=UPI0020769D8C|nr:ATP-binding cassette domain-containing protein [Rhizobium sp. RCAM05350]